RELFAHLPGKAGKVDRAQPDAAPRDARERQERIDQARHALARRLHAPQAVPALLVDAARVLVVENPAETLYGAQRRAQVVRHREGEALELAIRELELRGALAHALFQLGVQAGDLLRALFELGDVAADADRPDDAALQVAQRDLGRELR